MWWGVADRGSLHVRLHALRESTGIFTHGIPEQVHGERFGRTASHKRPQPFVKDFQLSKTPLGSHRRPQREGGIPCTPGPT